MLIVEDEPGVCEILRETFKPIGFTVLTANNGQDALTIVKEDSPGLVFLDIRMLGMSGLEVLKEIKKIDPKTKVVMLTVLDDEKTKREAKRLGADDFVTKPFLSDHLEEVARKQISELIKEGSPDAES